MGTTGGGRLRDYQQGKEPPSQDRCEQELTEVALEEVAATEYYAEHEDVPAAGTTVSLRSELVDGRLAVQSEQGAVVGFLPTRYNYLLACIGQGYSYAGEVATCSNGTVPRVTVNLAPST